MRRVEPYLFFDNCCMEAMEFYRSVMGGDLKNITLDESEKLVLHAELHMGKNIIHMSDSHGSTQRGENVKVMLECDDEEEIRHLYESLQDGGEVEFELQETFWNALHASIIDRYGIGFILNHQM